MLTCLVDRISNDWLSVFWDLKALEAQSAPFAGLFHVMAALVVDN